MPQLTAFGLPVQSAMEKYLFVLILVAVFSLLAKNLVRGAIGRQWMAIRDMDVAASVIGIRPMYAKLTAFAVSSFIVGVAGALWGYIHLGSWEPLAFDLSRSFQLLFMVIIGGLGSIIGSFFGAAFIVLVPVALSNIPHMLGLPLSVDTAAHVEHMVFGALIVFFLIAEPHGLARLWSIGKEKLRIWPFPTRRDPLRHRRYRITSVLIIARRGAMSPRRGSLEYPAPDRANPGVPGSTPQAPRRR